MAKAAVKHVPPGKPMALAVKFNDSLVPLSGINFGRRLGEINSFTHGNPEFTPVKFTVENKIAYAKTKPYKVPLGFYSDELTFGPRVPPVTLQLNSQWRLLHGPFYSCGSSEFMGGLVRDIVHRITPNLVRFCVEVELYLVPFERVQGNTVVDLVTYASENDYQRKTGPSNVAEQV